MTEILQPLFVEVSNHGELVQLRIGNFHRSLEFATALEVAAMLKREARYAKASANDDSWRRSSVAVLHDAAADRRSVRRRRLPEILRAKHISVRALGQVVQLSIGKTTAGIPYRSAAALAQWLRVHGKVARNAAGERAHWSKIVAPHTLQPRA